MGDVDHITGLPFGKKVLIAMDGSKHSAFAFEWYAKKLYKETDHVIVAYCADHELGISKMINTENPGAIQKMIDDHNDKIKKVFKDIEELANRLRVGHIVERLHEPARESIVKAAKQQHVDLIIVGSRGGGHVRRVIVSSTSSYIVHHAHVPVLVCKHDEP